MLLHDLLRFFLQECEFFTVVVVLLPQLLQLCFDLWRFLLVSCPKLLDQSCHLCFQFPVALQQLVPLGCAILQLQVLVMDSSLQLSELTLYFATSMTVLQWLQR